MKTSFHKEFNIYITSGAEPQMQLLQLRLLEPGAEPGAALSGSSKSRWAGSRKNSAALPTLDERAAASLNLFSWFGTCSCVRKSAPDMGLLGRSVPLLGSGEPSLLRPGEGELEIIEISS